VIVEKEIPTDFNKIWVEWSQYLQCKDLVHHSLCNTNLA